MDLLQGAARVEADFHGRMRILAKSVKASYIRAAAKPLKRILEKTNLCYARNFARNLDLVRGAWIFQEFADIPRALHELQQTSGIKIVQVKNRMDTNYDNEKNGGYRDICIRLKIGRQPHICELQIHLAQFLDLKNEFGENGHKQYLQFRNEKCI